MGRAYLCAWVVVIAASILDRIGAWLARFDVDVEEGNCLPAGWVTWGWICNLRAERMHRYLAVKLPILEWKPETWWFGSSSGFYHKGFIRFSPWPGHFERSFYRWTWFPVNHG